MAQLFFKYGAMNSGKSIEILKVANNYEEQGKSVMLFTSGMDNRDEVGYISSRIGLKREATPVFEETDIFEIVKKQDVKPNCILLDEIQFFKKHHIQQLRKIVDVFNIPTMGFGLKNDFRNESFEGSLYMFLYAEKFEELKTICWFCNSKATMALRVEDGAPTYEGEQIKIGDNGDYFSVCPKCHTNPPMNEIENLLEEKRINQKQE